MGFIDTISSPAGIWSAFNQIAGPKEAAPMPETAPATDPPRQHQQVRGPAYYQ